MGPLNDEEVSDLSYGQNITINVDMARKEILNDVKPRKDQSKNEGSRVSDGKEDDDNKEADSHTSDDSSQGRSEYLNDDGAKRRYEANHHLKGVSRGMIEKLQRLGDERLDLKMQLITQRVALRKQLLDETATLKKQLIEQDNIREKYDDEVAARKSSQELVQSMVDKMIDTHIKQLEHLTDNVITTMENVEAAMPGFGIWKWKKILEGTNQARGKLGNALNRMRGIDTAVIGMPTTERSKTCKDPEAFRTGRMTIHTGENIEVSELGDILRKALEGVEVLMRGEMYDADLLLEDLFYAFQVQMGGPYSDVASSNEDEKSIDENNEESSGEEEEEEAVGAPGDSSDAVSEDTKAKGKRAVEDDDGGPQKRPKND